MVRRPGCMDASERLAVAPHIAVDEAVLAVMRLRQPKLPAAAAPDRLAADLDRAATIFKRRGWISEPAKYHRTPPNLNNADVLHRSTHNGPLGHESMSFASEFDVRSFEPGADRWPGNERNDVVTVRLLRRSDSAAPWVVILHGFGMGSSRFDLNVLSANYLHHRLGYNVALPISPLHGPRRESTDGQLLSLDLTSMLHGITQAVWDVRRLVSWIRSTTDAPVGLYGVSLGGYLSTVLAGLERFDAVAAALPFADPLALLTHHGPPEEYRDVIASDDARTVFQVVSPLTLPAVVAPGDRTLFIARADRLIPVEQSAALADSWHAGHVRWVNTGHAGFTWARTARGILARRFRESLGPT
jgi:pimeloyl-ACP methyl ester carboxylesterase